MEFQLLSAAEVLEVQVIPVALVIAGAGIKVTGPDATPEP
jgi:hypothetical protein